MPSAPGPGGSASPPPPWAPADPPPIPHAPTGSHAPPSTRGNGLANRKVLAIAAGVLLIALVISVSLIISQRSSAGESPPAAAPTQPAVATASTARATVANSQAAPEAAIRCWDDTVVDTIADCTRPSGTAGLRYVYPGYDHGRSCVYKAYRTTTATFDCAIDGGVLRFRWWRDKDEALGHYTEKYQKGSKRDLILDGQRVGSLYRDRTPVKGVYRLSGVMWGNFSFSVEAKSTAKVDSLLTLIEVRHPEDLTGYRLDNGPAATVGVQW